MGCSSSVAVDAAIHARPAQAPQSEGDSARQEADDSRILAIFGPDAANSILMDAVRRGISLKLVRRLLAHVEKLFDQGHFNTTRKFEDGTELSPVKNFEDLTATHVVYLWIKDIEVTGDMRFVDCPELIGSDLFDAGDIGVPSYFISHAWSGSFKKLLTSVLSYLRDASETNTFVWIDQFAVNQHRHTERSKAQNEADVGAFKSVVQICNAGTIVVVDAKRCNPASRAWCVYEWAWTLIFHGPDGLHMVGMTGDDLKLIIDGIDVEKARCFDPDGSIKKMILSDVLQQSSTYERFNNGLKLQLMLSPLSLRVDLSQLLKRSKDTVWSFDTVYSWIESLDAPSRAVCVLGGAGTGKSTVSAASIDALRTKSPIEGLKISYHFLKYSDQRRLDPVKILTSLAFILAPQIPEYEAALLSLDVKKVLALRDMDSAFSLLFEPHLDILAASGNILPLIDALDESDVQPHGKSWSPMSNKDKGSEGRVMLYDIVVNECRLSSLLPPCPHPTLDDLLVAYKCVFDRNPAKGPVADLLAVLMAAREPVSALLLSQLGLFDSLPLVPGSGCFFFIDEHRVFLLHKSLADWLLNKESSGSHHVDVARGNKLLAACLFDHEIRAARDPESLLSSIPGARASGPGIRASDYALKYGIHHLCQSLSEVKPSYEHLDQALGSWEFIRQVFESGHGALLMRDLGQIAHRPGITAIILESLSWLRMNFNDFEREPLMIEAFTLRSPLSRVKYQEAIARLAPSWVTCAVFGKVSQEEWPQFTHVFKGHTNAILSVAYSPDGTFFASAGRDSAARLWDALDGSCIAVLRGHTATISSVSFSADGKMLATASEDGTARLWDLASGRVISVLEGHEGPVGSVSISPSGVHVVTVAGHGGCDNSVRLYDAASGECILVVEDTYQCSSISFSRDGKLLGASCGHDYTAKVWDVSGDLSQPLECVATLNHDCYVNYACFSPDATRLATARSDRVARIWDLKSKECIIELKGHSENVVYIAYSDGILATGSWDNSIKLWVASSGEYMTTLDGHTGYLGSLAFSPCGGKLVTGFFDMRALQWDLRARDPIKQGRVMEGHTGEVAAVSFSPSGALLVTASHDSKAILWDMSKRSHVGNLMTPVPQGENWRRAASFSPNGHWVATGEVFSDVSVRVLPVDGGEGYTLGYGNSCRQNVFSLAFSPHGNRLATGFDDGTVGLWDLASKERVSTLSGHESIHLNSVAYSPDGRLLASGSSDHTVRLWDPQSGEFVSILQGHAGRITGVAFSPDGKHLATCSGNDNQGFGRITGSIRP